MIWFIRLARPNDTHRPFPVPEYTEPLASFCQPLGFPSQAVVLSIDETMSHKQLGRYDI